MLVFAPALISLEWGPSAQGLPKWKSGAAADTSRFGWGQQCSSPPLHTWAGGADLVCAGVRWWTPEVGVCWPCCDSVLVCGSQGSRARAVGPSQSEAAVSGLGLGLCTPAKVTAAAQCNALPKTQRHWQVEPPGAMEPSELAFSCLCWTEGRRLVPCGGTRSGRGGDNLRPEGVQDASLRRPPLLLGYRWIDLPQHSLNTLGVFNHRFDHFETKV